MKYLGIFLLLLCVNTIASAQVLIEDFNYTPGAQLTANGWTAHSGAGTLPETITATGLSYTGYASSNIGYASTLDSTGQDVNKTWVSYPNGITSGNLYFSLMVNLSTAKPAGDYFFHLYKNSTTFTARIYAKKATNGNISFGIAKSSTTANIAYSDSVYAIGTTYLLVVKYSILNGATNDTIALWINPDISGSEPAPTVLETSADRATADVDTIYGVAIRQGTAANAPKGTIDGIRVGTTWANSVGGVLESKIMIAPTSINIGQLNVGTNKTDSITVNNSGYDALNITSVSSSNAIFTVFPTSATISAFGSQKFAVTYAPTSVGSNSASIVFISNDATSPDTVAVSGSGVQDYFSVNPVNISFGNVWKDSTKVDTVTVTNTSATETLVIDSVRSNNLLFTVSPTNVAISASSSAVFIISFTPIAKGITSGGIVFYQNAALYHDTVKVSGNGILREPIFSVIPTTLNFGIAKLGKSITDTLVVKNVGYDSLIISNVALSNQSDTAYYSITPTTVRLDTSASQKFAVTFKTTTVGVKPASIVFFSNVSEVTDTVKATGKGIAVVSIAEARKDSNGDLIADHSITKDTLLINGVVTSKNLQSLGSQMAIFIQDSTAGIEIFAYSLPPLTFSIGDSVFAIGTVSQYRGATEFTPLVNDSLHFGIIKHNTIVPKPRHLTLHQFVTNAESYEGLLVEIDSLKKVSGTWPVSGSGASIYITNLSMKDTAQLYISSSTNLAGWTEPVYPINVVAIINQYTSASTVYNNGYEIEPSDTTDITKTKMTPIVTIAEARKDVNSDLIADHSITRDTLQIYGVITTPNLQSVGSQTAYFIQDATAGIEIFSNSVPPTSYAIGDSVMVLGIVVQDRGLVEFSPLVLDTIHFTILKHNAKKPTAQHLTLHQLVANSESYEGLLVEVDTLYKASGTWPVAGSNGNVYVTNASKADTILMFTSASTKIAGSAERAYPINVVGVVSQHTSSATVYNDGYELEPFDTTGIIHTTGTTGVNSGKTGIPSTYELSNNYPNPFNPSTTIEYSLPLRSNVTIKIYSILGQEVATLVNNEQIAGYYQTVWNASRVASGMYIIRITAQALDKNTSFTQVKKMMLLK